MIHCEIRHGLFHGLWPPCLIWLLSDRAKSDFVPVDVPQGLIVSRAEMRMPVNALGQLTENPRGFSTVVVLECRVVHLDLNDGFHGVASWLS